MTGCRCSLLPLTESLEFINIYNTRKIRTKIYLQFHSQYYTPTLTYTSESAEEKPKGNNRDKQAELAQFLHGARKRGPIVAQPPQRNHFAQGRSDASERAKIENPLALTLESTFSFPFFLSASGSFIFSLLFCSTLFVLSRRKKTFDSFCFLREAKDSFFLKYSPSMHMPLVYTVGKTIIRSSAAHACAFIYLPVLSFARVKRNRRALSAVTLRSTSPPPLSSPTELFSPIPFLNFLSRLVFRLQRIFTLCPVYCEAKTTIRVVRLYTAFSK